MGVVPVSQSIVVSLAPGRGGGGRGGGEGEEEGRRERRKGRGEEGKGKGGGVKGGEEGEEEGKGYLENSLLILTSSLTRCRRVPCR